MKNQPEAPEAPDYAAANEAGVQADINALPLRNAINAASTLGTVYTDPNTGKTYDFTGLGSQDIANRQFQQQLADAPEVAKTLLGIQQEYGDDFARVARDNLAATDPTAYGMREDFGRSLRDGTNSNESLVRNLPPPAYEQIGGSGPALKQLQASDAPSLARINGINLADTGEAAAGRSTLEQQIFDRLAMAGQSDPSLDRAAQQAARARGASSGNLYGDGSAMNEALAVQAAQRELDAGRRNDALQLLQSGQTTSDKGNVLAQQNFNNTGLTAQFNNGAAQQEFQNRGAIADQNNIASNQAFQNAMTAIGQRNQALHNSFAAQQSVAQQQMAARQQDTANKQSYLGLQPIVAQGSMLSGLQQGAAPTTSGTGYNAVGTAQNAGALGSAFAGNVFGTRANIFGTQSQAATAGNAQMAGLATSFLCHVARQVYGPENGRWVVFYYWKELIAPKWFRALYNRVAPQVAILIRPFPLLQSVIRGWMDRKIQIA